MLSPVATEAGARCPVCGKDFDPVAFQVLIPGTARSFDTLDCAERYRSALDLDKLPQPTLERLERLESSLLNARARIDAERRRQQELEAEIARLASEGEAERARRDTLEAERAQLQAERDRLAQLLERREGARSFEPLSARRRR